MTELRDLPESVEYLVLGTGVSESILSAALSRIGKTVLHLDKKEFYGGLWATFNFSDFSEWLQQMKAYVPSEDDSFLNKNLHAKNVHWEWGPRMTLTEGTDEEQNAAESSNEGEAIWTPNRLERLNRQFNIDIMPKFVFTRGETVDNLIGSDAGRYLEFHPIRRLVIIRPDGIKMRVPANRYEMFQSRLLEPRQKWQISSFLQWCVTAKEDDENIVAYEDRQLRDLLKEWKNMDQVCQQIVINTMAMARMDVGTREGMERLQRMLRSLNRYGPYPFLWPLYGSGELPQSYCRFSAVFGGVFCLGRTIQETHLDEDGACHSVTLCSGQSITVQKDLILHSGFVHKDWLEPSSETAGWIARAIFLTDGQFFLPESNSENDNKEISLLSFPLTHCQEPALVIELSAESKACPKGLYLVHITAAVTDPTCSLEPRQLFEPLVSELFGRLGEGETAAPRVLWSCYFTLPELASATSAAAPKNLHVLGGPDSLLDFDSALAAAKAVFERLCPGEDFLPRAPTADEILIEDAPVPSEVPIPPPAVNPETGDN